MKKEIYSESKFRNLIEVLLFVDNLNAKIQSAQGEDELFRIINDEFRKNESRRLLR